MAKRKNFSAKQKKIKVKKYKFLAWFRLKVVAKKASEE